MLTGDVDHPRSQFVALTSRTEGCVCWLAYGADLTCRGAAGIQRCLRWLARFLKAAALLSLPPVVFYVSAIIDVFGLVRGNGWAHMFGCLKNVIGFAIWVVAV